MPGRRDSTHGKDRSAWAEGWDAHPVMPAPPRWSFGVSSGFGKALMGETQSFSPTMGVVTPREGTKKVKLRETYIDELLRLEDDMGTGPQLGPGTHTPLHVERHFQQPEESVHGPKAVHRRNTGGSCTGGGGTFSRMPRKAVLTSLKHYHPTELASCVHTPGPGSYTQFSSFGQASGPTRTRFYPKSRAELTAAGRSSVHGSTPRS
mmetsp:Transcript_32299/g.57135  ORF Transcript_32299/g.57135 Transcript_32299/m.57135 type:complete len:206 (+) Transcript_32299:124-741(+)